VAKGMCADGTPVDQKVRSFQFSRNNEDFLMVHKYYDDYKDHWFKKVDDLIDEEEFDQEWRSKLLHSIETYREKKAIRICRTRGWSMNQKFNRWFYSVLRNWVINVKTQAFRTKRCPGIICPICFREIAKIEEKHLRHVRATKDLPKVFEYEKVVYKTCLSPKKQIRKFFGTLKEIVANPRTKGDCIDWPWFFENKEPAVICPYTKKKIKIIDDEYILKLPKKYRHYAQPYTWFEFQENFPNYMVHSDVKSLDYRKVHPKNKECVFVDHIKRNRRLIGSNFASYLCSFTRLSSCPTEYEHALTAIEKYVSDEMDQEILKCIMIGDEIKDICNKFELTKKELKQITDKLADNKKLEKMLIVGVIQ